MTTHTVAQPVQFTREDMQAAISAALAKVTDPTMIRAIHRAAANLAAGQFAFYGEHVTLRSASSTKVYHITTREPMTCSCQGRARGYVCWHIVASRLLVRAAQRYASQRGACPHCGQAIVGRQYYVGGRGYVYFDVCSGDGSHYGSKAA